MAASNPNRGVLRGFWVVFGVLVVVAVVVNRTNTTTDDTYYSAPRDATPAAPVAKPEQPKPEQVSPAKQETLPAAAQSTEAASGPAATPAEATTENGAQTITVQGSDNEAYRAIMDRVSSRGSDMAYLVGNRQGFVQNAYGDKCWYTQSPTRDSSVSHFYRTLTGADSVMVFDDPTCMAGEGVYQDININMVNKVLANAYHAEQGGSAYGTRVEEMHTSSRMQINGYCVQSGSRTDRAFLVNYFASDAGAIVLVVHNIALQGCATT